jgi:hypothetical protein
MEDVSTYFFAVWSILRPFGIFYGHLVYYVFAICFQFWYTVPGKIWQPCIQARMAFTYVTGAHPRLLN